MKRQLWDRQAKVVALGLALLTTVWVFPAHAFAATSCDVALVSPVPGPVVRAFSPRFQGGHWGVDIASALAEVVRAPASGRVTFAGKVAERRSVTIAPRTRMRVSLSYLSALWVKQGQWVSVGQPIGRSGLDHGVSAVHLSVRVGGRYTDPQEALSCSDGSSWGQLRLVALRAH